MSAQPSLARPKERPIIFTGEMVHALLDGRKTQTRRLAKPQPKPWDSNDAFVEWGDGSPLTLSQLAKLCPYGAPGARLWVRETFASGTYNGDADRQWVRYAATDCDVPAGTKWRPSIFMPRVLSRLTLEITDVRVQHLQEISEQDAQAEGCEATAPKKWWQGYRDFDGSLVHQQFRGDAPPAWMLEPHECAGDDPLAATARRRFTVLWGQINSRRAPWASNPWVWSISFRRVTQ